MALMKGKQVATGADGIATANIVDLAITSAKLGADSVITAKILDANITAAKLANDSVSTIKIVDANVTAAKLASDSVITAKILDANVTEAKLASDSVSTAKIVNLAVTTGKLAANAVTPAKADLGSVWAFTAEPTYNADAVGANGLTRLSQVQSLVSGAVTGLDVKNASRLATAAALPACTAAGSGVGKTLTGDANGALTVDGFAVANGDRVLVKNQAAGADNGIYTQTQLGTGGAPFILTRATDADQNAEVTQGLFTLIVAGTVNGGFGYYLTTADPITVDTTSLSFAQFTPPSSLSYGSPVSVGTANSDGVASTVSRSDHVHDSPAPSASNKDMTASVTTTDNDAATATAVAANNALAGYMGLRVNGIHYEVGNGTKTGVDAYLSGDAGVTARAFSAVIAGDTIHWNGSIAGFQLASSDRLDLCYLQF